MDFLAIAALFALLVFSYFSIATRKSRASANANAKCPEAPKVAGGWPLIGHLHLFGGSQLPHINLGALADKYGPVFIVNVGVHPTMMVNTWEAAKDCYTTNDLVISSRPMNVGTQLLTYNQAMLGFSPYGQYWRDIRKIAVHDLLSNRRLELLKHVRESEVEMTVKNLHKQWTKRRDQYGSSLILVEMKQWFMDLTLNVIFRMVAGKRYFHGNLSDGKEDRRCQKALREFFYYVGLFGLGDAVPWLKWLDFGGIQKATKQNAKELDNLVTEWLEEHKQRRAMRGYHKQAKETEQDFMDVMLSALDGVDICGFDIDTVMKSTILNLIAGGSDTTTVTLAWALAALLNDRRALNIVYEELDKHVGKERLVNESDVNNLVYLQAVVKEAMRLYPTAPFAGYRMFTEDCKVAGYHVPKGTWLLVNLWKVQTDPRVYDDPMEFKPERFLTTHKDLDVKGQQFEFMPFGSGRRVCPGIAFGMQMTHLTLASFLHAFEVSTPNNAPVDMSGSIGLSNMKSTPLDVLVKPRLPLNVYE